MSKPLLRRARVWTLVAVSVVTGAACVHRDAPGVAIRSLKSDIVFGLNPPAAPPPGIAPSIGVVNLPDTAPLPPLNPNRKKSDVLCRAATRNDSIDQAAPLRVAKTPKPGVYRWKATGTVFYGNVEVPLLGQFINREIFDVSPITESSIPVGGPATVDPIVTHTFSYSVKALLGPNGEQGSQVVRYQVKDNPISEQVGLTPANIGKSISAGDPERGVTLKRVTLYNPRGDVIADFNPTFGILLLPLSVNFGESYQSVAVDPANGAVIVHEATVAKRMAVDACGTLVDGWLVNSVEYFVDATGNSKVSQYDYVIATQLGAMVVYEKTGPPDLTTIQVPTPPVLPGNPLPNVPLPSTTIPPLPVELPATKDKVEFTIAQLTPLPPK